MKRGILSLIIFLFLNGKILEAQTNIQSESSSYLRKMMEEGLESGLTDLKKATEVISLKNTEFLRNIEEIKGKINILQNELSFLQEPLLSPSERTDVLEEASSDIQGITFQEEFSRLTQSKGQLQKEIEGKTSQIKDLKNKISLLQESIPQLESKVVFFKNFKGDENITLEKNKLQPLIKQTDKEVKSLEKKVERFNKGYGYSYERLNDVQESQRLLKRKLSQLWNALGVELEEGKRIRQKFAQGEGKDNIVLAPLNEEITKISKEKKKLTQILAQAEKGLQGIPLAEPVNEVEELKTRLHLIREENKSLKGDLEALTSHF